MKKILMNGIVTLLVLCVMALGLSAVEVCAATPGFNIHEMSDMSDFDPNTFENPKGDTLKLGLMNIFSGPGAGNGEIYWLVCTWIAYDMNKRGGILVDGKKKKLEIIKGDTQGKPAVCKKIAERLCLEEKVDILWGTTGSHLALIIQNVAKKYKRIFVNVLALSDGLMDGKNFNRYTFRTMLNTSMHGLAAAYYCSTRPEKKYYILCQDYLFGHDMAEGFIKGLKKYAPDVEIVGQEYHPLFLKDFAPYITKIMGSGAEVVYTADWLPDSGNLLKQSRDLGMKLSFVNLFMDEPNSLAGVGPEGTKGLIHVNQFLCAPDTPEKALWLKKWNDQWKNKWAKPYDTPLYKWNSGTIGATLSQTYWLMDVVKRAGSTKPDKIIKVWEGDVWNSIVGPLTMRACDHQAVMDHYATVYVHPNQWYDEMSNAGDVVVIPAKYCTPPMPEDLDRCKK